MRDDKSEKSEKTQKSEKTEKTSNDRSKVHPEKVNEKKNLRVKFLAQYSDKIYKETVQVKKSDLLKLLDKTRYFYSLAENKIIFNQCLLEMEMGILKIINYLYQSK